jgi:methionyl-tRNA formyltransferase
VTEPVSRPRRALIVGESGVPLQCAQLLLRAGHQVIGMVSPDPVVRAWATERAIPALHPSDDIVAFAREHAFDYLFSIVNYAVLPGEVLRSARVAAINYHDGPLPRYAGVYATTWAILGDESVHGVTWHLMVEEVDAGDILRQEAVPIAASDTAATLNVKCFFAAIRAFRDLLPELESGRLTRTPQDLSRRTYYGFSRRPPDVGVVRWSRPAAQLDRLVRALDFGTYANPIALPKVLLPNGLFAIRRFEVAESSGAATGTLVSRGDESVRVACTDGDVVMGALQTLNGEPVSIDAALGGAADGARLAEPADHELVAAHAFAERIAPHERFWIARLAQVPAPSPVYEARSGASVLEEWPEGRIAVESPVGEDRWLAALGGALRAGTGAEDQPVVVGLGWRALHERLDALGPLGDALFARWVPARLGAVADIPRELSVLRRRETFARDLLARTLPLRAGVPLTPSAWTRVAVMLGDADSTTSLVPPADCVLLARIVDGGRAMEWRLRAGAMSPDAARTLRDAVAGAVVGAS